MRLVRYSPQERVDLPDISAMSFLALGEFRRSIRGLIIGPGAGAPAHDNFIVRGFEAEASAVPDSLVTVRLVPTSGPLAFAIGGEDLGARIDFGQLLGGDDQAGNTEGNASVSFDFTGQPLATYRLQMRFAYATGVNDNRAFWNAGSNSEFIAAVDTRFLPTYELGIAVSPASLGDEYIPIADVVWGGATVSPGDITDVRNFAFEGAAPFDATTQTGAGGIADFDHSATRASVGLNTMYPVVRALARQIRDIKGEDDTGVWNWYGRPYRVQGTTAPVAAGNTKSLRTVELAAFTIGNGVETFGDFNGNTGLDACFAHIVANETTLPRRIRIIIREGDTPIVHSLATSLVLANKHIEIIGAEGGETGSLDRGRASISLAGIAAEMIRLTGDDSGLVLRNLEVDDLPADVEMVDFAAGEAGPVTIENCYFAGDTAVAGTSPVLRVPANGLRIQACTVIGRVQVYGPTGAATDYQGGEILDSNFSSSAMRLTDGSGNNPAQLTIRNCTFSAPATAYTAANFDFFLLWVASTQLVTIEDCAFFHHPDTNGVHLGTGTFQQVVIRNSRFFTNSGVTHGVDAGTFTTDGTGWQIWAVGTDDAASRAENLLIDNCQFDGPSDGWRDAGAIRIAGMNVAEVRDVFLNAIATNATASSRAYGILVENAVTVGGDGQVRIAGGRCENVNTIGTLDIRMIALNSVDHVVVDGFRFDGRDSGGSAIAGIAATGGALVVTGSSHFKVTNCHFQDWDTVNSRCVQISSTNNRPIISGCTFASNAGFAIQLTGGSANGSVFTDNSIQSGVAGSGGIDVSGGTFTGNICNNVYFLPAAADCISIGTNTLIIMVANNCNGENIRRTGGGVGPIANILGYDQAGGGTDPLNLNAVYV